MKIDESTIDYNALLAIKGVTENMADILSDSDDEDKIRTESLKSVLFSLGVIDMAERMKEVLRQ